MTSNFNKIQNFHSLFSRTPDPETPTLRDEPCRRLRAELIFEEFKELIYELGYDLVYREYDDISTRVKEIVLVHDDTRALSLQKIAKESADLKYVVYGTDAALGIPSDAVYEEVHASNMSKLGPNGEVIRREDGKVLKGPNYQKPDLTWIKETE